MSFVKYRKASHDIFDIKYMDGILQAYEELVQKLSSTNIYYEIIPKKYQHRYGNQPFGEAFSKTADRVFSDSFGRAYKDRISPKYNFNPEVFNFSAAFDTMHHYELADCWMPTREEQQNYERISGRLRNLIERHQSYNEGKGASHQKYVKTTMLVNNLRIFQNTLEVVYWSYMKVKYQMLDNASINVKTRFRERELAAKDQYIQKLENAEELCKQAKQNKMTFYLACYKPIYQKLKQLEAEISSLRHTVRFVDQKKFELLTGLPKNFIAFSATVRHDYWKVETERIHKMLKQQLYLFIQEVKIQAIMLELLPLRQNILANLHKIKENSTDCKIEIYDEIKSLPADLLTAVFAELTVQEIRNSQHPTVVALASALTNIDNWIKEITAAGFVKKKKEMQEQNRKIDQLEMKILRHAIDTTIEDDVQDKNSFKTNSSYSNDTTTNADITADTPVTLRQPKDSTSTKTINSKKYVYKPEYTRSVLCEYVEVYKQKQKLEEKNNEWKTQLTKLHKVRRALLKKQKPNEKDLTKYETALDAFIDKSLKQSTKETSYDADKVNRMEKASLQMITLMSGLTLELAHVDTNLEEMLQKFQFGKHSSTQDESNKTCDFCKSSRSRLIECTNYITHLLYEDNFFKFYMLTTVMNQLSFLLHMIKMPICKQDMPPRDQISMKIMRCKLTVLRNQLKQKIRKECPPINFSLSENPSAPRFGAASNVSSSLNLQVSNENSNDKDFSAYSPTSDENQSNDKYMYEYIHEKENLSFAESNSPPSPASSYGSALFSFSSSSPSSSQSKQKNDNDENNDKNNDKKQ